LRDGAPMGGFQAIMVSPGTGVYRAGSDHRKDGQAVGY
jgi:gamma-glutamyltranspeptidase